ncbi:MAG TPA: serine/threonine-protein kinase, partial [Kofleriaceae bacterium]|nr:serine/threonine-protein kinase [Kofleriaceae bacterium]
MSATLATDPPELEGASPEALPAHFDVRGVLGQGGMGVVLEAHDRRLGRDVAIKVLTTGASGRRRFVREARAAAVLRDPTIVTLYELSPQASYIVMELVRGETLRHRLARVDRLPADEVRRVGAALCRALGVAHAAGIIHRDVKPSNVLLDQEDAVRLADFGVAAFEDSDLTQTGSVVGTP